MKAYGEAKFKQHEPFYRAKKTIVDGIGFSTENQILICNESQIVMHDIQNMGANPQTIYESENPEVNFTFECMPNEQKIIIVEADRLAVIDLK